MMFLCHFDDLLICVLPMLIKDIGNDVGNLWFGDWNKQYNNADIVTETANPWRRSLKGIFCDECSHSPCH